MTKKNPTESKEPASSYEGEMDSVIEFERDTSLNIHQRIHAIMKEVWYVQKTKKKDNFYDTVEHDDVTRKIRPALIKYGVLAYPYDMDILDPIIIEKEKYDYQNDRAYITKEILTQAKIYFKFVNIDSPEDYTIVPSYGHGLDQAGNAPGKAISYAIKYAFLKQFNFETGIEEDRDHLFEVESDPNAIFMYDLLGEEIFGKKDWKKKRAQKIYSVTKGKTSDPSRANPRLLNEAIRNLYDLKKKQQENPESEVKEIEKAQDKENMNDILKDFE